MAYDKTTDDDMTDMELYEEELRLKRRLDDLLAQVPPASVEECRAAAEAYTRAYHRTGRVMRRVEPYRDE